MKLTLAGCMLLLSVLHSSRCSKLPNDYVDPGPALFLTPLIEAGQLDQARTQSQVLDLPGSPEGGVGKSYSGYLTVNKKYNSNLFFWYIPAQVPEPLGAPVVLWLDGGPGGSSLFTLFTAIGPVSVTKHLQLQRREYAWTSKFHMVYIDQPAGTGFSFTDSDEGYATNQTMVADDLYQALVQFFTLFKELQHSDFYIAGHSYAGKYVPAISYKLHQEQPAIIRFRGLAIGNGYIDPVNMLNYGDFLYQLGFLDDNQRDYFHAEQNKAATFIRQKNWKSAFLTFKNLLAFPLSSFENFTGNSQPFNFLHSGAPEDWSYYAPYVRQEAVKKALHVGNVPFHDPSVVQEYLRDDIMQSVAPLLSVLADNYKVLLYTGQLDVIVAYPLTANFLKTLKWSGAEEFKKASRVIWKVEANDTEVAGYVRKAGNFYDVLVRNAAHMAPYDQPRACLDMITRFVFDKSFS